MLTLESDLLSESSTESAHVMHQLSSDLVGSHIILLAALLIEEEAENKSLGRGRNHGSRCQLVVWCRRYKHAASNRLCQMQDRVNLLLWAQAVCL